MADLSTIELFGILYVNTTYLIGNIPRRMWVPQKKKREPSSYSHEVYRNLGWSLEVIIITLPVTSQLSKFNLMIDRNQMKMFDIMTKPTHHASVKGISKMLWLFTGTMNAFLSTQHKMKQNRPSTCTCLLVSFRQLTWSLFRGVTVDRSASELLPRTLKLSLFKCSKSFVQR